MEYEIHKLNLSDLTELLNQSQVPVVLLEGTRKVPKSEETMLTELGAFLAREFPRAIFRSGNAEGADTLFARGVERVDPQRMQLVVPSAGHRKKNRHLLNEVFSLGQVDGVHEEELAYQTQSATPANQRIIDKRHEVPQLMAKARYLLRDTLKVMGDGKNGLAPATASIFYTQADPMSGGTGHTILVCLQNQVPVPLEITSCPFFVFSTTDRVT